MVSVSVLRFVFCSVKCRCGLALDILWVAFQLLRLSGWLWQARPKEVHCANMLFLAVYNKDCNTEAMRNVDEPSWEFTRDK